MSSLPVCRIAQFVLSREDPDETFLKSLPSNVRNIEIMYPVSMHGADLVLCRASDLVAIRDMLSKHGCRQGPAAPALACSPSCRSTSAAPCESIPSVVILFVCSLSMGARGKACA
eukprot:349632-Chlamydomonas_euryale.AAC.54